MRYGDKCKCGHVLLVGWAPIAVSYEEQEVSVDTKIWYCPDCQEIRHVGRDE